MKDLSPNGFCYTETTTIGGIDQTILVQAKNKEKPVLLVLHGDPGMPFPGVCGRAVNYVSQFTAPKLIENFTLVYWDQRGTGRSYHKNISKDSMNLNQYILDAGELVDYLRNKFNVNKIYLAGISWGSIIGLNLVNQFPEKFFAYYGLSQIINWAESDRIIYPWVMNYATSTDNKKAIKQLRNAGVPPYDDSFEKWNILRRWLMKFNGYVYKNDSIKGKAPNPTAFITHLFTSPDFTIKNALNTFKGMVLSYNNEMIHDISKVDFTKLDEIEIPVYFFHGRHDKVCDVDLMEQTFNQLVAPLGKRLIWLDNSAHFFYTEDAKKVEEIMIQSALSHA
jgi:pimeloyl-ACP methyl ester carboxylesterase